MTLPSQPHLLTPSIIATELFGNTATTDTRVKTVKSLTNLVGQDKARSITNIAFHLANSADNITQNGEHPENIIKPLTKALENSGLFPDHQ